jgi:hypothetical protein
MASTADSLTFQVFNSIAWGGSRARRTAQQLLDSDRHRLDLPRLRLLILDALSGEFAPDPDEAPETAWARCWLLSTLGRISADDPKALATTTEHLDPESEPFEWARYWALEGLLHGGKVTNEQAQEVANSDPDHAGRLATAILASRGDRTAREAVLDDLHHWTRRPHTLWTLRSLRVVFLPAAVSPLGDIVKSVAFSDPVYDAIVALGKAPPGSQHARAAAQALSEYVKGTRYTPWMDGVRAAAIRSLGAVREETSTSLLLDQTTDENPEIVRDAARALEEILGPTRATTRIVEAATGADGAWSIEDVVLALRWMQERDLVVEQLEDLMLSGPTHEQDIAKRLLNEIGGVAAFRRLQAQTRATAQYLETLEQAEERVREQFTTSIEEARRGFKIATAMDVTVFVIGILLIAVSATLALAQGGNLETWAGVGVTGGLGVLGVVYGTLIAKPRQQVDAAVNRLMYVKIVFLAYVRQLHQADQAYTRRLLEQETLTTEEVRTFSTMIESIMRFAASQLPISGVDSRDAESTRADAPGQTAEPSLPQPQPET